MLIDKNCDDFFELISAYIDREVSRQEAFEVTEHLLGCGHCRKKYEALKETSKAVKFYFEAYKPDAKIDTACLLMKIDKAEKYLNVRSKVAIAGLLAGIICFSVTTLNTENQIKTNIIYESAEQFVSANAFSSVSDGVLAVVYEN